MPHLIVVDTRETRPSNVVVHAREMWRRHKIETFDIDIVTCRHLHQLRGACIRKLLPAIEAGALERGGGGEARRQVGLP
eukprot:scaffold11495_cov30-Tisochrysis_lutea.AAC.5